MIATNFYKKICTHPNLSENDKFRIKIAVSEKELAQAQALRYEVFKAARGIGLKENSFIDTDIFDDYCLHLLVEEKITGRIVGTYRLQSGEVARRGAGFYSEQEFSIEGLDHVASKVIEAGRSCVSEEYRNGSVIGMLWAGIAEIMNRSKAKYLIGCVSLDTTDSNIGWELYRRLADEGKLSEKVKAVPLPKYVLPASSGLSRGDIQLPPLFKGYLRLGCKICGEPVLDRDFETIDFLILIDTAIMPERFRRHFKIGL